VLVDTVVDVVDDDEVGSIDPVGGSTFSKKKINLQLLVAIYLQK